MPKTIPNTELTSLQKVALKFIHDHIEKYGKDPTVRALAEHMDRTPTSAFQLMNALEAKGFLKKKPITELRMKISAKGKKAL